MIDLGKSIDNSGPVTASPAKKGKKYYPTIYISGVDGLDIETGNITFTAKGNVMSVTESKKDGGKTSYSCEIELHSIDVTENESDDGLDGAMKKIEKKKMEDY